jgi:CDP-diacylglycerol--glycerol-3-phosphate 3-phosphatidyltransferase
MTADVRLVNLPNVLTVARLLCVPVVLVLLFWDGGQSAMTRDLAAVVFVAASITDFIDGAIARRRGQVTPFGRILDPIADKALVGGTLIGLSVLGALPWWATVVIMVREIVVTVVRFTHRAPIPVSRGGKAKTLAQTIAITMYLVVLPGVLWWSTAAAIAMGIALVLTVVTGIDYLLRALRS